MYFTVHRRVLPNIAEFKLLGLDAIGLGSWFTRHELQKRSIGDDLSNRERSSLALGQRYDAVFLAVCAKLSRGHRHPHPDGRPFRVFVAQTIERSRRRTRVG